MTAASGKAEGGIDTARILLRAIIDEHHVACERLRYPRRCTFCFACKLYDRITAHLATPAANGLGEADGWLPIESAPNPELSTPEELAAHAKETGNG